MLLPCVDVIDMIKSSTDHILAKLVSGLHPSLGRHSAQRDGRLTKVIGILRMDADIRRSGSAVPGEISYVFPEQASDRTNSDWLMWYTYYRQAWSGSSCCLEHGDLCAVFPSFCKLTRCCCRGPKASRRILLSGLFGASMRQRGRAFLSK